MSLHYHHAVSTLPLQQQYNTAFHLRLKTKVIQLRVEPHIKAAAEKAAEIDRRNLSNWLTVLILDRCKLLQVDTTAPLSKKENE